MDIKKELETEVIDKELEINRLKALETELTAMQAASSTVGDIPQIKEYNVNINPEIIANIPEAIEDDIKSRTK